ncbi:MAG: EamA family transporter RarD [Prolixibacteraceae bacterium]|nr:EamA family transporter RarD [Prolixibacteraceae bacterium]
MKTVRQNTQGIIYVVLAYLSWGVLPIYWKQLDIIPAVDILTHRILWSSLFTLAFCLLRKREYLREYFTNPKALVRLTVTGILVAANWGVYIYAINSEQIVEASLGYFINPLVSIVLGMLFLGEKLNKTQLSAFLLAMIGVAYLTVNYGRFPWIAVTLAVTFGVYGLMKKKMNYDSMSALAVETTLIVPLALGYILLGPSGGGASFSAQPFPAPVLLVLAGIITALPLYWFGMAAVKIPLYSIGFFQYIAPTIKLFVGVYLFHETFSATHAVSFSFIWAGLALYIGDMIVKLRRQKSKNQI